jgi:hypothetical protein
MKRITKKPWFGPRKLFGYGWSPITWQGWLSILLFAGLDFFAVTYLVRFGIIYSFLGSIILITMLLVVITLTGDKPNYVGLKGKK